MVLRLAELAGGQAVEIFIRDQDHRPGGHIAERIGKGRRIIAETLGLHLAQFRARLDEGEFGGIGKLAVARDIGEAQRIRHQRATTGTDFNEMEVGRCAHGPPFMHDPQADQFAEYLADFRRRNEIRAEAGARGVIALAGVMQGELHVS